MLNKVHSFIIYLNGNAKCATTIKRTKTFNHPQPHGNFYENNKSESHTQKTPLPLFSTRWFTDTGTGDRQCGAAATAWLETF